MNLLKKIVPFRLKRRVKIWLRGLGDLMSGDFFRIAKAEKKANLSLFSFRIEEKQPFRRTAFWENKIENNRLAASKIEATLIGPGQIFSFWKIVGEPSEKNGFRSGRTIRAGKVEAETGGGMCQLSGAIYFLALRAGFEILERWPHSVDLYAEEERFAPLGSDATVYFGFKDLRFRNPFSAPFAFSFDATDDDLTARLGSTEFFEAQKIDFFREEMPDGRRLARAFRADDLERKKPLAVSVYLLPQKDAGEAKTDCVTR